MEHAAKLRGRRRYVNVADCRHYVPFGPRGSMVSGRHRSSSLDLHQDVIRSALKKYEQQRPVAPDDPTADDWTILSISVRFSVERGRFKSLGEGKENCLKTETGGPLESPASHLGWIGVALGRVSVQAQWPPEPYELILKSPGFLELPGPFYPDVPRSTGGAIRPYRELEIGKQPVPGAGPSFQRAVDLSPKAKIEFRSPCSSMKLIHRK